MLITHYHRHRLRHRYRHVLWKMSFLLGPLRSHSSLGPAASLFRFSFALEVFSFAVAKILHLHHFS